MDDAAIAAVIVALRTMRESGGTLQLQTRKREHRRRLLLNGLDRMLTVIA